MEYYLTIKRNDILIYAITWINLEKKKLTEGSQMQKTTNIMIPFI